MSCWQSG